MVQGQIRFSRFSEVSVQRDREKKEMEEGNTPFTGHSEPPKLGFSSEQPCVVALGAAGALGDMFSTFKMRFCAQIPSGIGNRHAPFSWQRSYITPTCSPNLSYLAWCRLSPELGSRMRHCFLCCSAVACRGMCFSSLCCIADCEPDTMCNQLVHK